MNRVFDYLLMSLRSLPAVMVIGRPEVRIPVLSFAVSDVPAERVVQRLADNGVLAISNVSSRVLDVIGVNDIGGAVTVGLAHYTTTAEVDQLVRALWPRWADALIRHAQKDFPGHLAGGQQLVRGAGLLDGELGADDRTHLAVGDHRPDVGDHLVDDLALAAAASRPDATAAPCAMTPARLPSSLPMLSSPFTPPCIPMMTSRPSVASASTLRSR